MKQKKNAVEIQCDREGRAVFFYLLSFHQKNFT